LLAIFKQDRFAKATLRERGTLGDGSEVTFEVYAAKVIWDGEYRDIPSRFGVISRKFLDIMLIWGNIQKVSTKHQALYLYFSGYHPYFQGIGGKFPYNK
jgi:hypothetical protein